MSRDGVDSFISPLRWPDFYLEAISATPAKKTPVLHFIENLFSNLFATFPHASRVEDHLNAILALRAPHRATIELMWETSPQTKKVAKLVRKIILETYPWRSDLFIPNDPFSIVFLMPWDDLEISEVIMELEEKLVIHITDEEMEKTIPKTLGAFVDFIVSYLPPDS